LKDLNDAKTELERPPSEALVLGAQSKYKINKSERIPYFEDQLL
jgi:hypothetical protein